MAAVAAAITTPAFMGCSSSNNSGGPGGTDGGGTDGGTVDTGPGKDSSGGQTTAPPQGNVIFQSESASVYAVTKDNFVLYIDSASNSINAVPLAGGQSTSIAPVNPLQPLAFTDGTVVYVWSTTGAAKFYIWTSAKGAQQLASKSEAGVASSDGTFVAWEDNVTASTADIVVANVDGTGKTVLKAGVDIQTTGCSVRVALIGGKLVASWCPAKVVTDAGAPDAGGDAGPAGAEANVSVFGGASWTETPIATKVSPGFAIDPNATKLLTLGLTGDLTTYAITGGAGTKLDTNVATASFTKDGSKIFYTTNGKELKSVASGGGTPTSLAAAGSFPLINTLSPDEKWVLGMTAEANVSGILESDFLLASGTAAGSVNVLTTNTSSAIFGDAFTDDSSHVLWYEAIANGAGDLKMAATAGGAPTDISKTGWLNYALGGSKVLYADNGLPVAQPTTVDMHLLDTATGTTSLLVSSVDPQPAVTPDKTQVVYSWHQETGAKSGIWVMPAPQ